MKYLFFTGFLFICSYFPGFAQWADNGSVISTTDNVGIGTATPSSKLDVEQNFDGTTFLEITNSSTGQSARRGIMMGNGSPGHSAYLFSTSPNYSAVASWPSSGVLGTDSQLSNGLVLRTSIGKIRFQPNGTTDKIVFSENGSIGVGTETPNAKADVWGVIRTSHSNERYVNLFNSGDGNAYINYQGAAASARFGFQMNGSSKLSILNNGYVGIGTVSPKNLLDIGNAYSFHSGGHKVIGIGYAAGSGGTSLHDGYVSEIRFDPAMGYLSLGISNQSYLTNQTGVTAPSIMILTRSGNVGIGTTVPDSRLTVKGTIHTQEVKVDLAGAVAPDFVFEENYNLPALAETEAYIKSNKHLPGIPSAAEMEENGLGLKEMNLLLLQKVEELTLHLIEQDKKISKLQQQLASRQK